MNLETFSARIRLARERAAELQQRADLLPNQQHALTEQALEDLQITLEELRVAEEELRVQNEELASALHGVQAQRERYHELFEFAPDGYFVTDQGGVIREANRAAAGMVGVERDKLAGKPLLIFVHKDDRRAFLSELERHSRSSSETFSFELRLLPRHGEPYYGALKVGIIRDAAGEVAALRWMLRDISEQKEADREIRALNAELERLIAERTSQLESAEREVLRLKKQTEPKPRLPLENVVLSSLRQEAYERILPHLEEVPLPLGEVLYRSDDKIDYVYFPTSGMISLVSSTEEGESIEVGMVGRDGMIGMPLFLGSSRSPYLITVQIAGKALRLKADRFEVESARNGSMHSAMLGYAYVMLTQLTQSVVCNRFHSLDERFCRWLLMAEDCAQADSFALTQEFISQMLGVRRSGVTVAARTLQEKGLIRYTRGNITILDRPGLETSSCECYRIVREETRLLLRI
ncbi:MAG TPA: PAS domain S-box protein [Blastocatellia bacterium]|nr:PAS domain S-box protein [Blastocatellia bacterium]